MYLYYHCSSRLTTIKSTSELLDDPESTLIVAKGPPPLNHEPEYSCGRWGEVEIEKGPVDLFPTEPTDEAIYGEETLNHGFKELLGI